MKVETHSQVVEAAVQEMLDLLMMPEKEIPSDAIEIVDGDDADVTIVKRPDTARIKKQVELSKQMQIEAREIYQYFKQQFLDSLLQLIRCSMDILRRRLLPTSQHYNMQDPLQESKTRPPVFKTSITLALPTIVLRPALDDIQQAVCSATTMMVSISKQVFEWQQNRANRMIESQVCLKTEAVDSVQPLTSRSKRNLAKMQKVSSLKNCYKYVSENKEILKLQSFVSTIISSMKKMTTDSFETFTKYQFLWTVDRDEKMKGIEKEFTLVANFHGEMKRYRELEDVISSEADSITQGPLLMVTDDIKLALVTEAKAWVISFGRAMNMK